MKLFFSLLLALISFFIIYFVMFTKVANCERAEKLAIKIIIFIIWTYVIFINM
jgi:hypothetical protein